MKIKELAKILNILVEKQGRGETEVSVGLNAEELYAYYTSPDYVGDENCTEDYAIEFEILLAILGN